MFHTWSFRKVFNSIQNKVFTDSQYKLGLPPSISLSHLNWSSVNPVPCSPLPDLSVAPGTHLGPYHLTWFCWKEEKEIGHHHIDDTLSQISVQPVQSHDFLHLILGKRPRRYSTLMISNSSVISREWYMISECQELIKSTLGVAKPAHMRQDTERIPSTLILF